MKRPVAAKIGNIPTGTIGDYSGTNSFGTYEKKNETDPGEEPRFDPGESTNQK